MPNGKERGERERLCTVIIALQQGQYTQKQANKYSPMCKSIQHKASRKSCIRGNLVWFACHELLLSLRRQLPVMSYDHGRQTPARALACQNPTKGGRSAQLPPTQSSSDISDLIFLLSLRVLFNGQWCHYRSVYSPILFFSRGETVSTLHFPTTTFNVFSRNVSHARIKSFFVFRRNNRDSFAKAFSNRASLADSPFGHAETES